ncbi:MAG: glycosyltransferase [Bacillota bacterium]|nr:glycosyltransferase [Bacillota bacterium]
MKKISIIVPVYNVEKYLECCLESLVNQTLSDIEIILVDDGSKDSSGQICDRYSLNYSNIKVLHIENGGPARARNKGLELAEGKYIGFVDSDDYVELNMFEELYKSAESNNSDIVMCSFYINDGYSQTTIKMNCRELYNDNQDIKNNILSRFYSKNNTGLYSIVNKIFKNSLIKDNNISFVEGRTYAEDTFFSFDSIKSSNTFSFLNKPFYHYRQVEGSLMHKKISSDAYFRYKDFRNSLMVKALENDIPYDKYEFYSEFLFSTVLFCRDMALNKDYNRIKMVFNDPFFKESCQYKKDLPFQFNLICKLAEKKLDSLAIIVLRLWNFWRKN